MSDFHLMNRARTNRVNATKKFVLRRLNKDGQPSRMHDAVTYHTTADEAFKQVAYVRSLNPGKRLRYALNGAEI